MKKMSTYRVFGRSAALVAAALTLGAAGCDDGGDGAKTTCRVTPGAWSSAGFETNAAEALELREAIRVLQSDLMNAAEQQTWGDAPTAAPTLQDLIAAYEAGDPSVADMTAPALDAVMRQTLADWTSAMAEDPATYLFIDVDGTEWVAAGAGGVHERPPADTGTRRFRAYSASGVELRQLVDKGLFVGALYNYALGLTEGTVTPATIHAIAAAWGANPALDVDPAEGEPANDDTAVYARTMGLYDETAAALTAAQAYAADSACGAERDAALVEVFRRWEEAAFARGTYYAGVPRREALNPSDPESVLEPLHAASEGYGLILGMLGIANPSTGPLARAGRLSTDADITRALGALGVDLADLSTGSLGQWLVESPTDYEAGFTADFQDVAQTVLGWSDALFEQYATTAEAE
jgi:hypothetical protein